MQKAPFGVFYFMSLMSTINTALRTQLATLISAMQYEFVNCELVSEQGRKIFRIYINRENGIKADDCAKVSRQVSAMLDVDVPFDGRYTLEVSSPGIKG